MPYLVETLLFLLPFAAYGLALLLPRVLYRDRRGLRGGA